MSLLYGLRAARELAQRAADAALARRAALAEREAREQAALELAVEPARVIRTVVRCSCGLWDAYVWPGDVVHILRNSHGACMGQHWVTPRGVDRTDPGR